MQLIGLADTRKIRHCERFQSGREAIRLLRKRVAGTAADDYGALNVYDDKFGRYRCDVMRWHQTVDSKTFTSLRDVSRWVAEWLEKIARKP